MRTHDIRSLCLKLAVCFMIVTVHVNRVVAQNTWDKAKAIAWYKQQPWLAGCNYLPVTAINQLEMWQAQTFDTATIEKELALAESIGFNTLRVFLHDKLWQQNPNAFKKRSDIFSTICAR